MSRAALRPETRLVVSEAPTNPYNNVLDIAGLTAICKDARVKTIMAEKASG